ncbi:MAG: PP2C family protein-serine/threonine phosphatase [Planctomycetota bacterium]
MRLSFKLLLISELVLLIAVLVLVVPVWTAMRGQVVDNMQNELKAIASTAALQVDGDLHNAIRTMEDADHEAFGALREKLREVQQANGIAINHIYTFYRDGDQMRFAVMLNPRDELFIGNTYPVQDLMVPVLEQGTVGATELYRDEHGEWISAYAPIRDARGEVVGLLEVDKDSREYFAEFNYYTRLTIAVDKDSREYFAEFNYYTRLTIALGLLSVAVSSLLGWWVLERIVIKPLSVIQEGIVALGRRDFTHRVKLATNDELKDLGETLNGISKQLDVARVVQQRFFPRKLPAHPRYRLAARSVPCDATGGDYYDAFTLEDGRIVVLVADVSGHGLGPSLLMASCRSALRGLSKGGLTPGLLVERLGQMLADELTDGRFITLVYGVLDDDGRFTYANCGHGPAIIATDGKLEHLGSHRPPLGVDFGDPITETQSTLTLTAGDRILLASDGLTEAMNASGEYLGLDRVEPVVRDRAATSETVVARLQEALVRHCGGPSTTDDVTMLCVDRI